MTDERLERIFDKTDGCCHICHKQLSYGNYGYLYSGGAWEVEHSNPKAKGGTNHLNNLYAACISCNREKGTMHTRTARSWHGNTRAPYSRAKKQQIQENERFAGLLIGGGIGLLICAAIDAYSKSKVLRPELSL